ncbi:MAG: substrate-binding domain-containing protein [Thermodesulfobacteriota bacterium]
MRRNIVILMCLYALTMAASLAVVPAVAAGETIRFAASSQIADAYGRGVAKEFEALTGVSAQVYTGPNETVLQRLMNGVSDLAVVDRPIPGQMKASGFVEIPFCQDPVALITNAQCTLTQPCDIDNLSEKQVRGIFSGQITNWKELGGADKDIIVIIPSEKEGVTQNFRDMIMRVNEMKYHFMAYDSTVAVEAIKYVPGSISFVSKGVLAGDQSIKIIKINGFSTADKDYPIIQTYSFATKGEPAGRAKSVINFGLSKRGIEIMKARGMRPVF